MTRSPSSTPSPTPATTANFHDLEQDPRFRFVEGDICDRDAVLAAMDGHDAVVHFAAESHVDRSIASPDEFVRTNCDGTNVHVRRGPAGGRRALPAHLHRRGLRLDRRGLVPGDGSARAPVALLGQQGRQRPDRAVVRHDVRPARWCVTRSSNNFGPYQFPEKVIPLFTTNLLDDRTVPLYGDGGNVRDWCYVEDNCRAVDLVLRQGTVGEIYNIGAGNEVPNIELTKRLLAACGKGDESIEYVTDRLGHDRRYSIDTTKVEALGWRPQRELDEALEATVAWYRDNRWWWQPLKARAHEGACHRCRWTARS